MERATYASPETFRYLPLDLVHHVAAFVSSQQVRPLSEEAVPGTSEQERRNLAALGGLAAALAGGRCKDWPQALRDWAVQGPIFPQDLINAVRLGLSDQTDLLALIYERLVSGQNRRRLGTFFTPPAIVAFMLDRAAALLGAPAVVIDPGAGVGAFSLAARRRWQQALVIAVDVNVVTLGLLAANADGKVELVLADYLSWALSSNVPGRKPRLWIGNPPYTRHQELPPHIKQEASESSGDFVQSGLAGLSAHFLAVTLRALAPEDGMCLLLPGSWTEARYGRPLRDAIRNLSDRAVEFHGFSSDVDVFPGTRVTAMVTVVGPSRRGAMRPMRTWSARVEASGVEISGPVRRARQNGAVEQLGLWLWRRQHSDIRDWILLENIARVRRGVATGANDFFLLKDNEKKDYPSTAIVPSLRRLRYISGDRLTAEVHARLGVLGERRWLLRIASPSLLNNDSISKWMKAAEAAHVPERYLPSNRKPWYLVEDVEPPNIIISPMGKRRLRSVVNEIGAVPVNSLYGIYVKVNRGFTRRLTRWLNGPEGQAALFERTKAYAAGLFKLEPKDLLAIRIPREFLKSDRSVE